MFYRLVIFFSLIVLVSFSGFTQDMTTVKRSTKIETIGGKKYYVHEIQKGETIYAISKAYNVDKNIIAIENPDVFDKFQPGQILHIPVEKGTTNTNKQSFTIHVVKKGETLYSISKKYNVTINDITKFNSEANNGLQIGQKLNIPTNTPVKEKENVKEETKSNKTVTQPTDTNKYIYHKVEKGQTMYSISKQYDVSIDKIYQENPQLENQGLKNGELIKIPKEKKIKINEEVLLDTKVENIKTDVVPDLNYNPPKVNVDCQKYNYSLTNETFKIVLLLPLQGDAVTLEDEDAASVNSNFEPQPKPFLEYYEGFLLAVDSMRKTGLNISLKIVDLKKDSARTLEIINKGELNDIDLIVGPVYENNFGLVSDFALKKGINIIYPINSQNTEVPKNSRVFLINSSLYSQMSQATKYMAAFNDVNYVVIQNGSQEEKDIMGIYKKILFKEYSKNFKTENEIFYVIKR